MIICVCQGISDRVIRSAIRSGCSSVRAVRDATGAGGSCGNCACDLKRMVRENHANASAASSPGPAGALLR